jgi:hypothetical protein
MERFNLRWLCNLKCHDWRLVADTGVYVYEECNRCSKRLLRRKLIGGYQPIKEDWRRYLE